MKAIALLLCAAILVPTTVCAQDPEITGHTVIGMKRIDLVFSVPMLRGSITKPGNIKIFPTGNPTDTLETWTVYLAGDNVTVQVHLIEPMTSGDSYTLSFKGVYSATWIPVPAGYEYTLAADDITPPELASVAFLVPHRLDLVFAEEMVESEGEDISNYSLFETLNPGNVIGIGGARMRGVYSRVMLELDTDMTPGTQYTITAADLHDLSGNTLPPGSELTFVYTGSNERTIIGLYADGARYNTAVSGTGVYTFDMWMWIRPGDGAKGALFIMDYPSNVTPHGVELNPNFEFNFGDIYNGAVVLFDACQYDWAWVFKQTVVVNDDLPSLISIYPFQDMFSKNTDIFRCDEGFPLEAMNVTSGIEINAPDARPVAVDAMVYGYTMIDILFSIGLDETTAETVSNYEVFETAAPGNTVTIVSATLQPDGQSVRLVASAPLSDELEYTARMSGIESSAGVSIYPGSEIVFTAVDNTKPVLLSAAMSGNHTVDLLFDEPVDDLTANSVLNYTIMPAADPPVFLDLHSAELQDDGETVQLTVGGTMVDGTDYIAYASNVEDLSGNIMLSASEAPFTADDVYPPLMTSVSSKPGNIVNVFFDEILDSTTAVDLNNYQMRYFKTWELVPLTGAVWDGNKVVLSRSGDYGFGGFYKLFVQGIEDPLGNAIPSWEMMEFIYTPETPEPLIGLWVDSERLDNTVEVYPFNMFDIYVWVKSGPNGLLAIEFALENTSLQNLDFFISGIEYDPDYSTTMGDAYSGFVITHYNCHTDWFWIVHYTAFLLDGRGYVDIVPHPLAGGIHGTLCTASSPVVDLIPVSRLTINEYLIGTLLQSSSAEYTGDGIEISWVMAEMDEEPAFIISRKKTGADGFATIESPLIECNGMEFRYIDRGIEKGASYVYRVEYAAGDDIRTLFQTEEIATPTLPLTLRQNHPNPFNPSTVIGYYLPNTCHVRLEIYNVAGRRVAVLVNGVQDPGGHDIEWNGTNAAGTQVSSGIYFYRLTAGKETIAKKMVLLR